MRRGWCPGVHQPMPSGDGLLIRVKPFGGRLSAAMLRTLAVVGAGCGNGAVELTGRGNIQLRGLTEVTAPLAAAALVDAGLADPDPVRESRRNVIAVPPCDDALVATIEATLADIPGLATKFCVAIGPAPADIQLHDNTITVASQRFPLSRNAGEGRGEGQGQGGREGEAVAIIRTLAEAAKGQRLSAPPAGFPWQPANPPSEPRRPRGLLLGLPFGQTDAAALMRLADLIPDAVRTSPWRGFFVPGRHEATPFTAAGFITDPDDPRRSIAACAGAPACANASVPARADAAFLASRGLRNIHVSGCAKGCAHPAATTTLVGNDAAYGFIRHGHASDRPQITGLTIAQAAELLA